MRNDYRRLDGHRFAYISENGTIPAVLEDDFSSLVLDHPDIARLFS